MKKYNLAIVGGCGSSGTTLLTHLLSKHPDIGSGPEFNCFNHFEVYDFPLFKRKFHSMYDGKCAPWGYIDVHVFMTNRQHYGIDLRQLESWVSKSTSTDEFLSKLCLHMGDRFQTEYFVEKSPTNIYAFRVLAENFPHVPLVHLVRDGRDVAASLMKRGFNLYSAGTRWLYDTLSGMNARGAENYIEVSYEQLVHSHIDVLGRIFEHIGVNPGDYGKSIRRSGVGSGEYYEDWERRKEPRAWNQTPADPISTASIGSYKKRFSKKDLSTLYRIGLTDKARQSISSDIKTFGELVDCLGNEPLGEEIAEVHSAQWMKEKQLEVQDFLRRFSRYYNNARFALPARYTFIKRR